MASYLSACLCILLTGLSGLVSCNDFPCLPRRGDLNQGYVCVCSSTYCDTVSRPLTLEGALYHHYSTSKSTPGFTHSIGAFKQNTASSTDEETVVFTIDPTVEYQQILGFGGTFTDTSGMMYTSLPKDAQQNLLESYFGPSGIEYSMGRLPIGSTDFSPKVYTYDDHPTPDEDLAHFSLSQCDHDYKIPLIQKAMQVSERNMKLLGCTWAAPTWMKVNNTPFAGYVSQKYQHHFAKYHIKFLDAYKDNGINLWGLTGGNEVVFLLMAPFPPGMLNVSYNLADGQIAWMKDHLRPLLKASKYNDIKLLTLEDMRPFAKYFMDTVALDPEAYAAIDGVALHWYFDWYFSPQLLDDLHGNHTEKIILYTESSCNGICDNAVSILLGSWHRANIYAYNIIENLNHWANGYMDWNLALDTDGGPTSSYPIDAPVIVNQTSGEFYKQPMFYVMGHFSKFIQPNARRIKVNTNQKLPMTHKLEPTWEDLQRVFSRKTSERGTPPLPNPGIVIPQVVVSVAAANPDNSVTVVVLNAKNVTQHVRIEDPRLGSISLNLEEYSLNTFVYSPLKSVQ